MLSVCLLTRNAEENLRRALPSLSGLGGEVLVVDTGSTDGTVATARSLGARVIPFAWDDDFAAAQNFALDQAEGDWILWLNPDEELAPPAPGVIEGCLAQDEALGFLSRVAHYFQPEWASWESRQMRLFRRSPAIRFRGRLTPEFVLEVDEPARRFPAADLLIRRHAYTSVQTQDKVRWRVRLLERELQDRPDQLAPLVDYGRSLLLLNEPRGHEVLARATEKVWSERHLPAAPSPAVGSLLEYLLTVSPQQNKSGCTRAEAEELVRRWFPDSPPLLWAMAQRRFQAGDFLEAAAILEQLLALGRRGVFQSSFNAAIVGDAACWSLGLCWAHLKEHQRAAACFAQLLNSPTYQVDAAQHLRRLQALQRQEPP